MSMCQREGDDRHPLAERFREFVRDGAFPRVGAKSAIGRGQMKFIVARDILSSWDDPRIYIGLLEFAIAYGAHPKLFQSFVVVFERPARITEDRFEDALWTRVRSLADKDAWHGQDYDARVSADPESPSFLSELRRRRVFFVIGLHPFASRPARRFERPALVFNPHDQFERPRAEQRYEPLRKSIIERNRDRRFGQSHARPPRGDLRGAAIQRPGRGSGLELPLTARPRGEVISSGRSLDCAGEIYLTTGDPIYSNRSRVMLRIVEDTVGRHDFLLTPCSKDTFRILYGDEHPHRGCFGNLAEALRPYGVGPDRIPTAFNVFMNVTIDGEGRRAVGPPSSKPGDHIVLEAEQDLIVALTACSAPQSTNPAFKPIHHEIIERGASVGSGPNV